MQGQIPNDMDQCYCEKQDKWLKSGEFYTYRDGSKTKMCKKCLTMHVDPFKPETYTWLLKEMDVPYIEGEWKTLVDKDFAKKGPKKMSGTAIFGKYISKMKLQQFKNYRWADTEKLRHDLNEKNAAARREETEADKEFKEELQKKFDAGEISEAEYKTLMPTEVQNEQVNPTTTEEVYNASMAGNAYDETKFINEKDLPDPAAELTDEDKIYLAMKWGRVYKPNEWVTLERDYKNMMDSFDIQDADTKSSLILICKLNLKANQALDEGDYDGFAKLSRELGNQRKLANFAAVGRKKDEKTDFVDSVGEMVAYCEKYGGQIPEMKITAAKDVVDTIITDQQNYLKSLVYSDPSLAREIEDYIKNKEIQAQQKKDREAAKAQGLDQPEISDDDIADYHAFIHEEQEKDDIIVEGDEA